MNNLFQKFLFAEHAQSSVDIYTIVYCILVEWNVHRGANFK